MATSNDTPNVVIIQIGKGYSAIVDIDDFDLSLLKWNSGKSNSGIIARRGILKTYPKQRYTSMHRLILSRMIGRDLTKDEQVDHINHNTLDNRRCNLRLATRNQNIWNRTKMPSNQTGFKGIYLDKQSGKYRAEICVNGKRIYLGRYATAEEGHAAYCEAAIKHHGEFANFGED